MNTVKKDQCISVQVPPELKAKARTLAQQTNRSLSGYVRQVLRSHIREYESLHGSVSQKP